MERAHWKAKLNQLAIEDHTNQSIKVTPLREQLSLVRQTSSSKDKIHQLLLRISTGEFGSKEPLVNTRNNTFNNDCCLNVYQEDQSIYQKLLSENSRMIETSIKRKTGSYSLADLFQKQRCHRLVSVGQGGFTTLAMIRRRFSRFYREDHLDISELITFQVGKSIMLKMFYRRIIWINPDNRMELLKRLNKPSSSTNADTFAVGWKKRSIIFKDIPV